MEEINSLNQDTKNEIAKEQITQNEQSPTKIIIDTELSEFKKPEDPKPQQLNEIQSQTQTEPEIPQPPKQDPLPPIEQNEKNDLINNNNINNNNQIIINNNNNNNNNINASNTNLTLITNTDPGYIASQSNEISSMTPPSKSKILKKKIHREYICEMETCGRVFSDKSSLRKHLLTHGEKLFVCEICKKKFLDNSKLRRHSLVHSGEKPYSCPMCPKKFSLDFNLRTHMRIHSGEKPYACVYPGCFKRFSQSSNLSAHEKTHELMKKEGEDMNKPIFNENPLKIVLDNPFSGKAVLDNIKKINDIYEMMRKGIIAQMNMINLGNNQIGRNHGEIPGMPIQKRTYIKKLNKENNGDMNNISNYDNIENSNINNKLNKKYIFHINDKDKDKENNNDINSESINNDLSDKNNNQFLAPLKPSASKKKLLFETYRDPSRINSYEIINTINTENSRNSLIDLSGKKKKHISDFNNFVNDNDNDNEDDFINREIELIEDKNEEPENDLNNYNNYKIDEKELDNFEKF